jgi:hypothetical protein
VFVHAGKMVHFLTRALLLSLALASLSLAWLCCWLDRFRCSGDATGWIIPVKPAAAPLPERHCPTVLAERLQPQPRTIDSLIRNKGVRV